MTDGLADAVRDAVTASLPVAAPSPRPPDPRTAAALDRLRWLDLGQVGTAREVLSIGEPGLRFFERYAPLYTRYTGIRVDQQTAIVAPYRSLEGIDLAAFRRDAAALDGVGALLDGVTGDLRAGFTGLAAHWRGEAADAFAAHVHRFVANAAAVGADVVALGRVVSWLGEAVAEWVRARAEMVLGMDSPDCGGLGHQQVAQLVATATGAEGTDDLRRRVGAVEGAGGAHGEMAARAAQLVDPPGIAADLLDRLFVPAFETRLALFRDQALDRVEDEIRSLWSDFAATVAEPLLAGLPSAPAPGLASPAGSAPAGDTGGPVGTATMSAGGSEPAAPDGAALGGGAVLAGVAEAAPDIASPEAGMPSEVPGGASLGQAGPGGASLGSVPDRDQSAPLASRAEAADDGDDLDDPDGTEQAPAAGRYDERGHDEGWYRAADSAREQNVRERLRGAPAGEPPRHR